VEANKALIDCYNKIKVDDSVKRGDTGSLCSAPKERVKELLRSDQLVMSNLVRQRVEILHRLGAMQ
jgi:hypothetical protein